MPAAWTRMFVALRPSPELGGLIWRHKRRLLAAAGPQLYATDPPHATLYLASFAADGMRRVAESLSQVAWRLERRAVTLAGWQVFESDPLTGGHTLACRFDEPACDRLRLVQAQVLAAAAPWHAAAATHEAAVPRWANLSGEQRRRALLFGFPYVAQGWIPHLTIASVRPEQWPHVAEVFQLPGTTPAGSETAPAAGAAAKSQPAEQRASKHFFTALDLYELQGLEPRLMETFPFRPRQLGKAA